MPNEQEQTPDKKNDDGLKMEIDKLKAENAQLAKDAKAASEKADRAAGLMQRMLGQLETLAQRGNTHVEPDRNASDSDPLERLKELHNEDPIAAVNELFNMRMGPLMAQQNQNMAIPNRDGARERAKAEGLDKFNDEVDEFMKAMPEDVKAKPGSWDAAYRYVAMQHINEIVDDKVKVIQEKASRPEGASGGQAPRADKGVIDPMEREVMKALGVEEKDWIAHRDVDTAPVQEKGA